MPLRLTDDDDAALTALAAAEGVSKQEAALRAIRAPRPRHRGPSAHAGRGREVRPASGLLESIVRNHPLVDGNKRLGWLATVVFYGLNGVPLDAPEDPAYDLDIGIAEGRIDYHASARLLTSWTTP